MIAVDLDNEQGRKVTVSYVANELFLRKQYLDDTQIANYKFMLNEFANLVELNEIVERFDRAWPDDVNWNS